MSMCTIYYLLLMKCSDGIHLLHGHCIVHKCVEIMVKGVSPRPLLGEKDGEKGFTGVINGVQELFEY